MQRNGMPALAVLRWPLVARPAVPVAVQSWFGAFSGGPTDPDIVACEYKQPTANPSGNKAGTANVRHTTVRGWVAS